jgi:hypothetical protein
MKFKVSFGLILLLVFGLTFFGSVSAQDIKVEEEAAKNEETKEDSGEEDLDEFSLSNLPYFLDDVMILAGVNSGNVYWSNHFRELRSSGGFQIGLEGFVPLGQVTFIDYGIHFAQRNFRHGRQDIVFRNNYLDFPLYASFMLPEFRSIDWRFFLGTQFSYMLSTSQSEEYLPGGFDDFQYDPSRFNRFDTGMTFGLSVERGNFFIRLRSFVGISRVDRMDQGGMNAFYLEGGYFLFRRFRQ